MYQDDICSLAIVGVGPKGLFCLERLIAHLALAPSRPSVVIHLFHKDGRMGCSPVYDRAQPEHILLNVAVGEVDVWTIQEPPSYAGRGPNFIQWHAARYPDAARLTGDEFLSRAIVGQYLQESFERLAGTLPEGVVLEQHLGEVVDLEEDSDGFHIHWQDRQNRVLQTQAGNVLLATGHSRLQPGALEQAWTAFADRHEGCAFISFIYPVHKRLKEIAPNQIVAIKGLGLTFIDCVLELTEGRGGSFAADGEGELAYVRSGREPKLILPFSRTGLPMSPKAVDLPTKLRPLTFFTPEILADLRREHGGRLALDQGPMHLFRLEMEHYYYQWAMQGRFADRLNALGADEAKMRVLIDAFHQANPDVPVFDPSPILDPLANQELEDGHAFHVFIHQYLTEEIERARRGFAGDGLKSAVDIWYEVRYVLSEAMVFGGLEPASHRRLMEEINPPLKRAVFGPPLINIEKLRALVRNGLLRFSAARAPRVGMDEDAGLFTLDVPQTPTQTAHVLIDGRYPEIKLDRDASPLYRNLLRRGMARAFENRDESAGVAYRPGSVDHTERLQHLIDADGKANPGLSVIGIPTEGNILGNFTIVPNQFPNTWAKETTARVVGTRTVVSGS